MLRAILLGPTSVGKTHLALEWAEKFGWEIISADSRQIYAGMGIGTGAPTAAELDRVRHHGVGHIPPGMGYSPQRFREDVMHWMGKNPQQDFLLVGGTGLYVRELLSPAPATLVSVPQEFLDTARKKISEQGMESIYAEMVKVDPEGMIRVHPHDEQRIRKRLEHWLAKGKSYAVDPPKMDPLFKEIPIVVLNCDRDVLHQRINARVDGMLASGWIQEVSALLEKFRVENTPGFSALGYRDWAELIVQYGDKIPVAEMARVCARVKTKTRGYAKKQITYFKHQFPGAKTVWMPHKEEGPLGLEAFLKILPWQE